MASHSIPIYIATERKPHWHAGREAYHREQWIDGTVSPWEIPQQTNNKKMTTEKVPDKFTSDDCRQECDHQQILQELLSEPSPPRSAEVVPHEFDLENTLTLNLLQSNNGILVEDRMRKHVLSVKNQETLWMHPKFGPITFMAQNSWVSPEFNKSKSLLHDPWHFHLSGHVYLNKRLTKKDAILCNNERVGLIYTTKLQVVCSPPKSDFFYREIVNVDKLAWYYLLHWH